jgi:hypothetical protein
MRPGLGRDGFDGDARGALGEVYRPGARSEAIAR